MTHCKHCTWANGRYSKAARRMVFTCRIGRDMSLVWCSSFQREPGIDDVKEETEQD